VYIRREFEITINNMEFTLEVGYHEGDRDDFEILSVRSVEDISNLIWGSPPFPHTWDTIIYEEAEDYLREDFEEY
jgi:hypothetical protein